MMRTALALLAATALLVAAGCTKKKTPTNDSPAAGGKAAAAAETPSPAPSAPGPLVLERVHFPLDRWDLSPEATRTLAEGAKKLLANPALRIRVEGHADERGSTVYNLALSEKRAAAVRAYLVDLGVAPDRIETIAFGEERPLASGQNEEAWAKNRRGELVVTGTSTSKPSATR